MTDREYYVEFWTPSIGKEEAERTWEVKQRQQRGSSAMVMPDIQPYRSQIDGSMIMSRSKHRTHLKDHGCIEIGNEKVAPKPMTPPPGLKEELIAVVNQKLRY